MKKQISYKIVSLVFSILVVCFAIAFYAVAWDEPLVGPPGGNIPAPLNTGPTGQSKEGGLILNTGGAVNGLIVDQGNVGIGTVTPSEKLDVVGNIVASGTICDSTGCIGAGGGGGFNPASYSGEESITFPNGLIMKMGYHSGGDGIYTVTFATGVGIDNFTSTPVSVNLAPYGPLYHFGTPTVTARSSTGFTVDIGGGPYTGFYWQVWGY